MYLMVYDWLVSGVSWAFAIVPRQNKASLYSANMRENINIDSRFSNFSKLTHKKDVHTWLQSIFVCHSWMNFIIEYNKFCTYNHWLQICIRLNYCIAHGHKGKLRKYNSSTKPRAEDSFARKNPSKLSAKRKHSSKETNKHNYLLPLTQVVNYGQ